MIAPTPFFDAHLDLAYLAEIGRDMHAPLGECRGRNLPAAITLDSLRQSPVRACLGTIFTEGVPDPADPTAETGAFAYPTGDAPAARVSGLRQFKLYQAWAQAGLIDLIDPAKPLLGKTPLSVGLLMECADPIESPDHLEEFPGLLMVGLAWARGSRYAAGNWNEAHDNPGLTPLGRELVDRLDEKRILHDVSHLSDRALDDLLAHTSARVVATHSNCRSVASFNDPTRDQRQLSDETIREIGKRGGVVGLNLYALFIDPVLGQNGMRPPLSRAIDHVEHVCEVMGHRRGVGLGSDLDGGFAANRLPEEINTPADFPKLLEELSRRGWGNDDLYAIAWGNWARVIGLQE